MQILNVIQTKTNNVKRSWFGKIVSPVILDS